MRLQFVLFTYLITSTHLFAGIETLTEKVDRVMSSMKISTLANEEGVYLLEFDKALPVVKIESIKAQVPKLSPFKLSNKDSWIKAQRIHTSEERFSVVIDPSSIPEFETRGMLLNLSVAVLTEQRDSFDKKLLSVIVFIESGKTQPTWHVQDDLVEVPRKNQRR